LLPSAPVGDLAGVQRGRDDLREPRSDEPAARQEREGGRRRDPEAGGAVQPGSDAARRPGRRRHDLGLGDRYGHLAGQPRAPVAADRSRPSPSARDGAEADQREHRRPLLGLLWRTGRERAEAEPRPRPGRSPVMSTTTAPTVPSEGPSELTKARRSGVFSG